MHREKIPAVDINEITAERRVKVRKIKGKLRRGCYIISNKITDGKTVDGVFEDINKGKTGKKKKGER